MSHYRFMDRVVNPVIRTILRSPVAFVLDRSVLLITVTGRRSGREYTLPVQYAETGDVLWIMPGDAARKTWWRNVLEPSPVVIRLRRERSEGTAEAISGGSEPALVEEGLQAFLGRFPGTGKRLGVIGDDGSVDEERLRAKAKELVVVRVERHPATA